MLSYRVQPDQDFVCKLHNKISMLGSRGSVCDVPYPRSFKRDDTTLSSKVRLFQDFYCLKDGKPWEGDGGSGLDSGGFVGALCQSVIFVPLFSAYLKPGAPHAAALPAASPQVDLVASGSIGLMKYLSEDNDKQDNVLLELILAMELHKYAVKMAHLGSFKSMFPCSVIFPLFQSTVVFDVTNSLSTLPSVITNQKALAVLKTIGITPSAKLANGTLSVKEVIQFYGNFQGMKLYDYGAEIHQIDAAAKRLLQCIEDTFSDPFELFDANYTEAYELRNFLNSINMSHFSSAMIAHKISSVEQFAALDRDANGILGKLATDASRVSKDSEVSEIIKLQAAVKLSQNSSLATPLEKRFRDFVDADAAFLTAAFSTSAVDIMLAKPIVQIVLFVIPLILMFSFAASFQDMNTFRGAYFPQSLELGVFATAYFMFELILVMLGATAAKTKSPRTGRYIIVAVLIIICIFCIFALVISVNDAVTTGCQSQCGKAVDNNISKTAKVFVQAFFFSGLGLFAASFACAMAVRQDLLWYTGPIGYLVYWFCFQIPSTYVSSGIINWNMWVAYFSIFLLILLPLLRKLGHNRAGKILFENQNLLNESFKTCLLAEGFDASDLEAFRCKMSTTMNSSAIKMTERLVSNQTQASPHSPSCIVINDQEFMDHCLSIGSSSLWSLLPHVWETQTCRVESNILQQTQASFTTLIRDAEFVNIAFQEWVSSWLNGGPTREEIAKYFFEDGGIPAMPNSSEATSLFPSDKHLSNEPFKELYSHAFGQASGVHVRGPVKHIDRAISKAYRSYFGNFRRLTDIVRCSIVLNTTADIQEFVKVHRVMSIFVRLLIVSAENSLKLVDSSDQNDKSSTDGGKTSVELQTTVCNQAIAAVARKCTHCISQKIDSGIFSYSAKHLPFTQRCQLFAMQLLRRFQIDILGLVPLHSSYQEYPASSHESRYAFELLRVRNRFGSPNPVGGYRDVNLKLRIGFTVRYLI